jgi:hypothetical protein
MRDPYAAFRINLEQQRKQAKDLLRQLRAGDRAARARFARVFESEADDSVRLIDAQFVVAREIGFASWRDLRAHVDAMAAARADIGRTRAALDDDRRTLHIRCGSDIEHELTTAGFRGDFLSLWDPLTVGPVTASADWIEQRARFHAAASEGITPVTFGTYLDELTGADRRLAASTSYDRVAIWMEHDSHDQLTTVRCLAHYARTTAPGTVDLISVDRFPGSRRFIGLGQLPPEAMRLLWDRRTKAGPAQCDLAAAVWATLTSDDPHDLAALMRTATPAWPHLAPALHRHLRELPSRENGLGLTQWLILAALADDACTVGELWQRYNEREPLPFLGDTMFLHVLNEMGRVVAPVVERTSSDPLRAFTDGIALTEQGRAVLRGDIDWLSLEPPDRWVGGVCIRAPGIAARWDEPRRRVVDSQRR